jgi:hypothetical protein
MGLYLPPELTEPLGWIGLEWPQADEELLFENGLRWMSFADTLMQSAAQGDAIAQQVWSGQQGEGIDGFREFWTSEDGPARRLAEDAAASLLVGAALIAFAVVTLAMKIAFIVQLIILLVQVAQAIAAAFATFGATTAAIPGFIALARTVCRQLLKQIVDHVQTVIRQLLDQARTLFRKVARRAGRRGDGPADEFADDALRTIDFRPGTFGRNEPLGDGGLPPNLAQTFGDNPYRLGTTNQTTTFYRAGDSAAQRGDPSLGQFWTTDPPSSVSQVRRDLAVREEWLDDAGNVTGRSPLNTGYEVQFPPGTSVAVGRTGPQGPGYPGGGRQVIIQQPWNMDPPPVTVDQFPLDP